MQIKVSKKKLISLAVYFVVGDLLALSVGIYILTHPDASLKMITTASGAVISTNEYQAAAHKIADAIKAQQIPGGRMFILGVWVDQNGKVYAEEAESHTVILDEDPDPKQGKVLMGGVNLVNLPFDTVSGLLILTEDEHTLVGQSATVYQRKPLPSQPK
ncbi:MAG: hypothetical protein HY774_01040 [Acidobacteria bacterium]|nr:hypothetical protein [Acidobacteriota bacterium]